MLDTLRVAALRIAAMNKADQDWIFSRLDKEDSERLKPLVQELETLGLENFDDVYESAVAALARDNSEQKADSSNSSTDSKENDSLFHRWSKAEFGEIQDELTQLSPALRASVISAYRWPWLVSAINHFELTRAINPDKIRSNNAVVGALLARCEG